MSDEILNIQLEIIPGRRKYPVQINAEEEELVRKAAKQLREKINAYYQTFSNASDLSDLDIIAMVAMDIAASHLRLERKNDIAPFTTKIQHLNEQLKTYLKEQ
jgi:cell division protein ZapA